MQSSANARVVIRGVEPEVECGRFAAKRIIGDEIVVEAAIFADGHDAISAVLRYRHEMDAEFKEIEMEALANDQWRARWTADRLGEYVYQLIAWADPFKTWRRDLAKRIEAGQNVSHELRIGAQLLNAAAARAQGRDAASLENAAESLEADFAAADLDRGIAELALQYADREHAVTYRQLRIAVDRERARFSAWYQLFPRSSAPEPGRHGTLSDCVLQLPAIAAMGFDVVYLTPIHPIGITHRKGKNNSIARIEERTPPKEPGSPWAIGAAEGGHKSILPELGSIEDFALLVKAARSEGMEIALDIAYQCSPDHPYVQEHPEWFRRRPDGTVQCAENPPNKYEDIYPFDFQSSERESLWNELVSVVEFWIEQGVRIFRVDNPHTKPFPFWEWMIGKLKGRHPDLIFLAEAFTRPNVMYWLSKLGFTQSYTYFTWRNTKAELTEYFTELTQTPVREYFRPNLWPNTHDNLHEYLQRGGRAAFMSRLVLAATLGANYGIYGPAYELCENVPRETGSEEYMNSELFEIKYRQLEAAGTLRPFISRVNEIRKANPALQSNDRLMFHKVENGELICYSKRTANNDNVVIIVVNLNPARTESGSIDLPLQQLGIDVHKPYLLTDLLSYKQFVWQGPQNYVELRPQEIPAHILRVG